MLFIFKAEELWSANLTCDISVVCTFCSHILSCQPATHMTCSSFARLDLLKKGEVWHLSFTWVINCLGFSMSSVLARVLRARLMEIPLAVKMICHESSQLIIPSNILFSFLMPFYLLWVIAFDNNFIIRGSLIASLLWHNFRSPMWKVYSVVNDRLMNCRHAETCLVMFQLMWVA